MFKKNFISKLYLFTSLFFILFVFYKSEIIYSGERREYFLIYYFIALVLIIFSAITFFLSKNINDYLKICILSIIFSLYTFESFLSLSNKDARNFKIHEKYKEETGKIFDSRKRIEVYEDLKKNNKNASVMVPTSSILNNKISILPFSGLSNSKTVYNNENGYYFIYNSDRYGFNNPNSQWDNKDEKYILVGDSFTHGCCVNRPDDIASVLRELTKKTVINLGYSSHGPLLQYSTLREYLTPDVNYVIWFYFEGNDLLNLNNELKSSTLNKYLIDKNFTQNLKENQNKIDKIMKKIIQIEEKREREKEKRIERERVAREIRESGFWYNSSRFLKLHFTRSKIIPVFQKQPYNQSYNFLELSNILDLSNKLVRVNNAQLFFVYLPEFARYQLSYKKYDDVNYQQIKKVVKDLKIPFIDIHKLVFKSQKNPLSLFPFEQNNHYNVSGYEKVANEVFNFIKEFDKLN